MSWEELLEVIRKFVIKHEIVWYRGQKQKKGGRNSKLNAKLFRKELDKIDDYVFQERRFYNYLMNLGHTLHGLKGWDLLFLMQHYGVPTRLLDWTESFAVALYFALDSCDETQNACIWMLEPRRLNEISIGRYGFFPPPNDYYSHIAKKWEQSNEDEFANSFSLYPVQNNNRMVAQRGVFTVQGNALKSLEEEFEGQLVKESALMCIEIAPEHIYDAKMFLELTGINYYSIFPDLSGLAKYLTKRYGYV